MGFGAGALDAGVERIGRTEVGGGATVQTPDGAEDFAGQSFFHERGGLEFGED